MTLEEMKTLLSSTGLPVTYAFWPEGSAPALPWICYRESGSSNFPADGIVYYPVKNIRVELYCQQKSPAHEALLESALTSAGIVWEKTEVYLSNEKCFETIYEIEV